jgi:membrane protein implicated in regulation of membrane protease activity
MTWWIWILIGFALLAFEFVSSTMHVGLFAVGAFVVGILVALGVPMPLWGQILIFTGVSLVALFFVRPILVRKLGLSRPNMVDTMIGEKALALDDIGIEGLGKAEMRGTTWSARNVGATALARGQRCTVERIDGLVLHVRAS